MSSHSADLFFVASLANSIIGAGTNHTMVLWVRDPTLRTRESPYTVFDGCGNRGSGRGNHHTLVFVSAGTAAPANLR